MERSTSRPFDTEAEARAFREGIEMVNDSAIRHIEITGSGPYVVTWIDRDDSQDVDHPGGLDGWLAERTDTTPSQEAP